MKPSATDACLENEKSERVRPEKSVFNLCFIGG